MIDIFERQVHAHPDDVFFRYAEGSAPALDIPRDQTDEPAETTPIRHSVSVTWRIAQERARCVARGLRMQGIVSGDTIASDMGNCPEFVYLVLACGYTGCTLVTLNTRLTDHEKNLRIESIQDEVGETSGIKAFISEDVASFIAEAASDDGAVDKSGGGADAVANDAAREDAESTSKSDVGASTATRDADQEDAESISKNGASADATIGDADPEDPFSSTLNYDSSNPAVIMFTSGTTGTPKAAALTWDNLVESARSANEALGVDSKSIWQLALPMYHIGGLQMLVRSVVAGTSLLLYRTFDAERILADARTFRATHVSVVDKTLRDLLDADEKLSSTAINTYSCVLLGGAAPNTRTIGRALEAHVNVYNSYGMTETSSMIAVSRVQASINEGIALAPGYDAQIIDPNDDGIGQLAVLGPGVFTGYLNANAEFTDDGYFLTGDRAKLVDSRLFVAERTDDMFVSGGENVYPAEIRARLLEIDGVTDAYVFGVRNQAWGRRPVAFIEARETFAKGADPRTFTASVRNELEGTLSHLYMPAQIFALEELPHMGIGKVDTGIMRDMQSLAMEITRVDLYRIRQPFVQPQKTAKTTLRTRDSIIVKVTDARGHTGIGEDVAFTTPWYLPETLDQDWDVLRDVLIPNVLSSAFLHPREASLAFDTLGELTKHPMACAAIEPAIWDLFGKTCGVSLRELIGARTSWNEPGSLHTLPAGCAPGGAVVGIGSKRETMRQVSLLVERGYQRIKMKIAPGKDVDRVRMVRDAYPDLMIMLDANQSYTERDIDTLKELASLNVVCIEEPLDPKRTPDVGPHDLFARLARLQQKLSCRVCLDESVVTREDLSRALEYEDLRCFALKMGKVGGIASSVDFVEAARNRSITVWMGGMYDTGISKRVHATLSMLPGISIPGDISDTAEYFADDITDPPFELLDGVFELNPRGHESGIGCDLDETVLERLVMEHRVFQRERGKK